MQDQVNVARLVIQKSLHLQSAQGHSCRRRSIIEKVIQNSQMNVIKCSRSELTKNKTSKVGNLLAGATQQKLLDCAIMNQFTLNMCTGNLKFFMEMKMQKGFLQTYLSRCMMQKSSHLWSLVETRANWFGSNKFLVLIAFQLERQLTTQCRTDLIVWVLRITTLCESCTKFVKDFRTSKVSGRT